MPKRVKGEWVPSLPYTHRAFRPYAIALGELALAWNDLHVSLSLLFSTLLGAGNIGPSQAVWQNIASDRMQRNVLSALASELFDRYETSGTRSKDRRREEIKWLCDRATDLEDFRNDALHSPLWGLSKPEGPYIAPVTGLGHIRASKLLGTNLLIEFRLCRDAITSLRNYAMEVDQCLTKGGTWPKRPRLPSLRATKQSLLIQTRTAKGQPPPRPSRA